MLICAAGKNRDPQYDEPIQQLESAGQTVVLVMRDEALLGIVALRDTLRDDARQAVDELHQLGVQGIILTGDNPARGGGYRQRTGAGVPRPGCCLRIKCRR